MGTYATTEQVASELGTCASAAEMIRWEGWISQAERIISERIDIAQRIADGRLQPATVTDVIVAAVARKAVNPDGLRSVMQSVDDASIQQVRDSAHSDGVLRILPDEWARLMPELSVGAWSFRPTFEAG